MTTSAPTLIPNAEPPRGVAQYELKIVERDGFRFVHVRFMLDDGAISEPFEFVPAFAYALSDELCKTSAHAAQK
jgi:hypothetical protein